ncbi:hypothetical protein, conserved [Eimeria tenella]|uniref:Uncharacterized protein n=1 Tax=Eimeria tenella TaxID=5802 RepID=U6KNH0_EIMTE|nr:hypothetical protein, conserved [Eimeria tenella]CDJ39526.1 hypothetical protein, conserved [Eimeria tenella]|eukprot:XP_013230281.1 hypothetical protein, conserved [Eimeria tenella]
MESSTCADPQRWRALHGKRTEELLKGSAAGLRTSWEDGGFKGLHRRQRYATSTEVAESLICGGEQSSKPTSARKLELYQRRNSSSKLQDAIKWTGGQEEPGVLNLQGLQGISVDSAHFRSVQSLKRLIPLSGKQNIGEILEHRFVHTGLSDPTENNEPHIGGKAQSRLSRDSHDIRGIIHHSYLSGDPTSLVHRRTSHVHAAENPCRWGVDVFNYQLPEPRKLRGIATEENLGANLVPKRSLDERSNSGKTSSCTTRSHFQGHLEPSTLCPVERSTQKFSQGKRKTTTETDSLDQTCTPFREETFRSIRGPGATRLQSHLHNGLVPSAEPESSRKRCSELWHTGSLQRDLTPQAHMEERSGRRQHPAGFKGSLERGSLMPM